MDQFTILGQGAENIVYQYIGDDPTLKDKVIRIRKPREICEITKNLILPYNDTDWTPLKKHFIKQQPYEIGDQKCLIMDNLLYNIAFACGNQTQNILTHFINEINDPKNQRFFMISLLKAQRKLKKEDKDIYKCSKEEIDPIISKYDPRKFYNCNVQSLFDSIIDLSVVPDSNLKLFNNQQQRVQNIPEFNIEDIAKIISETLLQEGIIQQLNGFFQMLSQMNFTIEQAFEAYEQLKQRNLTNKQFSEIVEGKCQDPEISKLASKLQTFSSLQALSDLSIVGSFRKEGSGKFIEIGNQKLFYQYTIIDCDLKPLNKITDYMSTIDELIKLRDYYNSLK
ncbi:unnamed protein product (macronuclear) [Paramecium tetraurelia]|uniref:Inositol-pentakisphosphate 2-kinase n=1 Tax=Paramecium tetraurelia TaxID=5888 RepID=A0BYJ4_PARTE|nr:uncharacterized protein GSPATT00033464001 [Paramecium tetraurelia]CAK63611.1 unnamed protein product [Paramecium tetraurelia]|eukprot:XP_001431009.1 hypothetical protein (macronuclear) [Paramecium tetraurelia strain d4-2]